MMISHHTTSPLVLRISHIYVDTWTYILTWFIAAISTCAYTIYRHIEVYLVPIFSKSPPILRGRKICQTEAGLRQAG